MLMLESQDAFIKSLFEQPSGVRSPPDSRKNQGSSKKLALVSIASKFRVRNQISEHSKNCKQLEQTLADRQTVGKL
jgi:hypothetical protein